MNLHEIYLATQLAGSNSGNTNLSDYYTKSQTDDLISEKVDKINGMGLSENNFTNAEKSKLAGLENTSIVTLSQSEYDALSTKVPNTIYMIEEAGD